MNQNELLKKRIQQILDTEILDDQRHSISAIAEELNIDSLTCAAALLYLSQSAKPGEVVTHPLPLSEPKSTIKMVRYRLDIGSQHQVTLEELKKVLVEESGVDKNNINNVNIRSSYTLIELPDAMPADIFQHLKTVEINQRKLDIKRVKSRHRKRGNVHRPGNKMRLTKADHEPAKQIAG